MTVKLDTEGIRCIGIFEQITGAGARDCIVDYAANKVILVVKKGDMGLAIGKDGSNINKVKKMLRRDVEVIEHSPDIKEFVEYLFRPVHVKNVELQTRDDKSLVYVEIPRKDKGIAIGKNGEKIKKVKLLLKRNHDIEDVVLK